MREVKVDNSSINAESYRNEPVRFSPLEVVDLNTEAAAEGGEYSNVVISAVNQHCLRLAVFDGDYPWHYHPDSDELFLVLEGCLLVDLADGRALRLEPWQTTTVPAGVVHRTRTEGRTVNICFEELSADTVFVEDPTVRADLYTRDART